jgi:DNA topoisomerase-2
VTNIDIVFKDGEISVTNNGVGFNINKDEFGRWYPEVACTIFKSGGNFNNNAKITGGKNGIGIKLTVAFSSAFLLDTVNGCKSYTQLTQNNMKVINPPIIGTSRGAPYTTVRFTPNYDYLKVDPAKCEIDKIITSRTY